MTVDTEEPVEEAATETQAVPPERVTFPIFRIRSTVNGAVLEEGVKRWRKTPSLSSFTACDEEVTDYNAPVAYVRGDSPDAAGVDFGIPLSDVQVIYGKRCSDDIHYLVTARHPYPSFKETEIILTAMQVPKLARALAERLIGPVPDGEE